MTDKPRILSAGINISFIKYVEQRNSEFSFNIISPSGTKALEQLQFDKPTPNPYKLFQIGYEFFGIEGKVQRVSSEFPNLPILAILSEDSCKKEYDNHICDLIINKKLAGFLVDDSDIFGYLFKVYKELISSNNKKSPTLDQYVKNKTFEWPPDFDD
jgi:hypothetical protein